MAQAQDVNAARRQLHVRDNPGYVIADGFTATTFDSPPDIEAAWEREIARRRQEVLDGTVELIDGEEVIRKALARYA